MQADDPVPVLSWADQHELIVDAVESGDADLRRAGDARAHPRVAAGRASVIELRGPFAADPRSICFEKTLAVEPA